MELQKRLEKILDDIGQEIDLGKQIVALQEIKKGVQETRDSIREIKRLLED
jgi:hypothetical protein